MREGGGHCGRLNLSSEPKSSAVGAFVLQIVEVFVVDTDLTLNCQSSWMSATMAEVAHTMSIASRPYALAVMAIWERV